LSLVLHHAHTHLPFVVFSRSAAPARGAAPAGAAAPAAAAAVEKPKVEEVDALEGGMDMFGGGGAKTGDY
jgi:ribosomal protein L12E/L44/L45/RPP1/RPP2